MPIRISGLNSGLDTDSIVKELVSAYRTKGDKIKKQQTKLSWTQDKWKSLNAKVLNLYKSLDNLRFSAGYSLKKTSVSDTTKATVTAAQNAVNGTQTLRISSTATGGYLTGEQLEKNKRGSSAKLNYLDSSFSGSGTVRISGNNVTKEFEIKSTDTINDFIKQINESGTGVKASYDAENQRIFIASTSTGKDSDFSLMGMDADGAKALSILGVNAEKSSDADAWKDYYQSSATDPLGATRAYIRDQIGELVEKKKAQTAEKENIKNKQDDNTRRKAAINYTNAYSQKQAVLEWNGKNAAPGSTNPNMTEENASRLSKLANMSNADLDKKYIVDSNGELVEDDVNGKTGKEHYADLMSDLKIEQYEKDASGNDVLDKNGNKIETKIYQQIKAFDANSTAVKSYEDLYNDPAKYPNNEYYVIAAGTSSADAAKAITDHNTAIEANTDAIEESENKLDEIANDMKDNYSLLDGANITDKTDITDLNDKDLTAYINKLADRAEYFASSAHDAVKTNGEKVAATDAEIYLNGAKFTSSTNTFNINGLTIQANAKTTEDITVTTSTDTQGLYDKIKDFITEYNSVIGEMASLYNAESSKGYEPLTSEEKEAMNESDIEAWEKKIKDSLLRRDSTLGSLISTMTSAMSSVYEVDGKKYSLATLGIKTGNYFNTTAATRNLLHIDGDEDDDTTSSNADKLMAMLNSDPDKVVEIMKSVTNNLYDNLKDKMKGTTLRSYQSIYNDKAMAISYSDYTKKISAWEEKVTAMEDSYYKKFAAMETALAKLQSQQSAFAGMLGSS